MTNNCRSQMCAQEHQFRGCSPEGGRGSVLIPMKDNRPGHYLCQRQVCHASRLGSKDTEKSSTNHKWFYSVITKCIWPWHPNKRVQPPCPPQNSSEKRLNWLHVPIHLQNKCSLLSFRKTSMFNDF